MFEPYHWRNGWIVGVAILVAIVCGFQIAGGSILWPLVLTALALALIVTHFQSVPLGTLILGLVVAGYLVGNRGFAQLSLIGGAPLLPAEFALAAATVTLLLKCAYNHESPIRRDLLNALILLWFVVGTLRFCFDLRHGFLALRDYALVYYSAFFFIAQYLAQEENSRHFLLNTLYAAGLVLLIIQPFYALYPDFFYTHLTIRGIPLILYKGDLLATSLAIVAILFFQRYEDRRQFRYLIASLAAVGPVLITNNRASLLALLAGTAFLIVGRRPRFAAFQFALAVCGAIIILSLAFVRGKSWETTPVFEVYERAASIVDPFGKGSYRGETTYVKGDNNAFRTVWWSTLVEETVKTNAWVGLGFGHDLAAGFLGRYYPTSEEDFTVRSPHNVLITVFARMGIVGLFPFLGIAAVVMRGTLRAVRRPRADTQPAALWCSAIALLTAACFGVVLEGPMGAILFWTLLGLANHSLSVETTLLSSEIVEPRDLEPAPTLITFR